MENMPKVENVLVRALDEIPTGPNLLEILPIGASLLGSAVGGDWLGAGAGLFSIFQGLAAPDDTGAWQKELERLAKEGWQRASKERSHQAMPSYPLPNQDASIDYVVRCALSGIIPTVGGLCSYAGTELNDLQEPNNEVAAQLFLTAMVRSMLSDRTYVVLQALTLKLRESDEARAKLAAELAAHSQTVNVLESRFNELLAAIGLLSAPGLRPQQREVRGDGLLDYLSDVVGFHGREEELNDLVTFCEIQAPNGGWRWQAITGPGGSGKSRLAFELCRQMRARGWEAYFLHREALRSPPPSNMSSSPVNMLLVIDYVAFATKQAAAWLSQLPASSRSKLRILLVERDGWASKEALSRQPGWHQELADAWNSADLDQHRGNLTLAHPVLSLADRPIGGAAMGRILESISVEPQTQEARDEGQDDQSQEPQVSDPLIPEAVRKTIIERLQSTIDPSSQRPLYLLFLAQAYLANPSDDRWRTWSVHDLHHVIYQRERKRIVQLMPSGWADLALDLWAFSTATSAVWGNAITEAPPWLVETALDQPLAVIREVGRALKLCCGSGGNDVVPYTPDIPGEYFVVSRLTEWDEPERVRLFAETAWEVSIDNYAAFLSRALVDLWPAGAAADVILSPQGLLTAPTNDDAVTALANALFAAVDPGYPRSDLAEQLVRLADGRRDDRQILGQAIRAIIASSDQPAVQLLTDSLGRVSWEGALRQALPLLSEQQHAELIDPLNALLERWVGQVLGAGMSDRDVDEFAALLDSEQESGGGSREGEPQVWLATHRPDYPAVVRRCMVGVLTAIVGVHDGMPWLHLSEVFLPLEAAGPSWSHVSVSALERPRVRAFALAILTFGSSDVDEVRRVVAELQRLVEGHPTDPAIALQYAVGLANLTAHLGSSDLDETRRSVAELARLVKAHPTDPAIALRYAIGLANLTAHLGSSDLDETRRSVAELARLVEAHPTDPAIALRYARGLVNLTSGLGSSDLNETRQLVAKLQRLTDAHPTDPAIALRHATGLVNLTIALSSSDLDETRRIVVELRRIVETHPTDPAIAEPYARGLVNLTVTLASSELDETRQLVAELRRLSEAYPTDPAIAEPYARGLFNLTAYLGSSDLSEIRRTVAELGRVVETHPADPAIALRYAKGLFNLTSALGPSELDKTRFVMAELRRLVEAHPSDPAIAEHHAMGLVNLTAYLGSSELNETRRILAEWRGVVDCHPAVPAIALRYAMGLVNLMALLGSSQLNEIRQMIGQLKELTARHPTDVEIALQLLWGLVVLAGSAEIDDTRLLVREAERVIAGLPTEDPLAAAIIHLDSNFYYEHEAAAFARAFEIAREQLGSKAPLTVFLAEACARAAVSGAGGGS